MQFLTFIAFVLTLASGSVILVSSLTQDDLELVLAEIFHAEEQLLEENFADESATTSNEMELHLESASTLPLRYGSQADVFKFRLRSTGDYSLRYLSVNVESEGLSASLYDAEAWQVYESEGKQLSALVGQGEFFEGNELRLRFFSEKDRAYLGKAGIQEFVLTAPVLRENPETAVGLEVSFPKNRQFEPAWLSGHFTQAWILNEKVKALEYLP